jgi:hypothetical protein
MPSSHVPLPAALWPPPRTATGMSLSRPNRTAATTSSAVAHRAITAGRLSIIAFHTARCSS